MVVGTLTITAVVVALVLSYYFVFFRCVVRWGVIGDELKRVEREPTSDPQSALDGLRSRTQAIESGIADATVYLPPYDVKRALRVGASWCCFYPRPNSLVILVSQEVGELSSQIDAARGRLMPRKKFAFGKKASKKVPPVASTDAAVPTSDAPQFEAQPTEGPSQPG